MILHFGCNGSSTRHIFKFELIKMFSGLFFNLVWNFVLMVNCSCYALEQGRSQDSRVVGAPISMGVRGHCPGIFFFKVYIP